MSALKAPRGHARTVAGSSGIVLFGMYLLLFAAIVTAVALLRAPGASAEVTWKWIDFRHSDCVGGDISDPIGIVFLGNFRDDAHPRPTDPHEANGAIDDYAQGQLEATYPFGGDWAHGGGFPASLLSLLHREPKQYVRAGFGCAENENEMASESDLVRDPVWQCPPNAILPLEALCWHSTDRYHMRLFTVNNESQDTYWVLGTPHAEQRSGRIGHCVSGQTPGHPSGFDVGRKIFAGAFKGNAPDQRHEVRTTSSGESQTRLPQDAGGCNGRRINNSGHVKWIRWGNITATEKTGPYK